MHRSLWLLGPLLAWAYSLSGYCHAAVLNDALTFGDTTVDERQLGISSMALDGAGFLWVVGDNGLCRSDGRSWSCVESSCKGAVFGSSNGFVWGCGADGRVLEVRGFEIIRHQVPSLGPVSDLVGVVEGDPVFSTATQTFRWSRLGTPTLLLSSPSSLAKQHNGVWWFATPAGLVRVDAEGKQRNVSHQHVMSIDVSSQGSVFAAATDGITGTVTVYDPSGAALPLNSETRVISSGTLLVDELRGALWLAGNGGVSGFDLKVGRQLVVRSMREGIPHPNVTAMALDRNGVWVGTPQGIARVTLSPSIRNLGLPEGMQADSAFAVSGALDGSVWMAQNIGLTRWKGNTPVDFPASHGLRHIDLRSVAVRDSKTVWASGLNNNLVKLDPGSGLFEVVTPRGFPESRFVHNIRLGPTGTLWVGLTDGGVGRLDADSWVQVIPGGFDGDGSRVHDATEEPDGTLWAVRANGTAVRLQAGLTNIYSLAPGHEALSLHVDASHGAWVGTGGAGMFRIKNDRVSHLTSKEGLWDDRVHAVIEDDHGWLWLSSVRGVFRIARAQADAFMDGWIAKVDSIPYLKEDGLRGNEATRGFSPPAVKDSEGRLWFAMVTGATVFDPARLVQGSPPKSVHVDAVQINGQLLRGNSLSASTGDGNALFRYGAPALWDASRVRYRVRLLGWNMTFVERGTSTEVSYEGLGPGSYQFEVQSYSLDRPDINVQDVRTVLLLPPFYRRVWFILCAAVAFVLAVVLMLRSREVRRAKLQAALFSDRSRIAQDIHDSLEQDLSGVKMHVDAASLWLAKDAGRAQQHLGRAAELVVDGMIDMRNAIWGLSAGDVQSGDLVRGLEQRLNRIATAAQIELRFTTVGDPRRLPSLVATQVIYIAREAMTNAVKHAHAQLVEVTLDLQRPQTLVLTVKDNGIGFDAASKATQEERMIGGLGLTGMHARAALIKGELEVRSSPEGGTTIELIANLS
jgi:signal transduction histidine kinase/ligand-binding sensor domain-containing protein